MKNLKIGITDNEMLESIINEAYFNNENNGKLSGKFYIDIDESNSNFESLKKMNNTEIKIWNTDVIDGTLKTIVLSENDTVKLQLA